MNSDNIHSKIYVSRDEHLELVWNDFVKEFEKDHYLISKKHPIIKEFVNQIIKDDSLFIMPSDQLYRARINDTDPYRVFTDDEVSAPPAERTNHGRLNVKGIPFLYMASDETTAMLEVRPSFKTCVSLAACIANRKLKILDLTKEDDSKRTHNFRRKLSNLFSLPINIERTEIDYRPTQYIAEYIKGHKFDGVKYKSSVSKSGANVCVFYPELFDVKRYKDIRVITL